MRDLLILIYAERKTLLKGMIISFLLTFPFTFLPAIIKNGLSIQTMALRLNDSIVYSFGFAVIVLIASVLHNYNGLLERKWHFEKPAFKDLDFYGRLDGIGSVVQELETFLIGEIGNYYFRLNLVETNKEKHILEIVPLIDQANKENEIKVLKKDHGFRTNLFFGKRIPLNKIDLEDSEGVKRILTNLSSILSDLNFESLEINEQDLED